jgi:small subunit ribosomal protein S14
MAKKSVKLRNLKRIKIADRFREKRDKLRKDIVNLNISFEERWEAVKALQTLPRDSSRCRQRNRCAVCGRPRAYNRLTGLCRLHMRQVTLQGMVPGMHKASW